MTRETANTGFNAVMVIVLGLVAVVVVNTCAQLVVANAVTTAMPSARSDALRVEPVSLSQAKPPATIAGDAL